MEEISGRAAEEGSLSQEGHAIDAVDTEQTNKKNHTIKKCGGRITDRRKLQNMYEEDGSSRM